MKDQLTDITIVLDRSGSMESRQHDAIGGFNRLVDDQKKQVGDATLTLIQFDDRYEPNFIAQPIQQVVALTPQTYQPRGSTALLDAIGRTINDTGARLSSMAEGDRPAKVLFVIITDGLENASGRFTRTQINQMISHQRDAYQWQFLFIGTEQDAIAEAGALGIPSQFALNYTNTAQGTENAYKIASSKLGAARAASASMVASAMAFTEEDRQEAEEE